MAPAIVSRAAWGANPLQTPAGTIATPAPELWLHHTGSTGIHGAAGMRSLQSAAINEGYVDIEYSWIVDNPSGEIFEARGAGRDSAATKDHNQISHAICVMGNFELETPADAVLDAVAELTRWIGDKHYGPDAITGPHQAVYATACCGKNLIAQIGEINRRAGGSSSSAPTPTPPPSSSAPPWPGRYITQPPVMTGGDVLQWQDQMHRRGWSLIVDGAYGPQSENVCRQFQTEKHLAVDGIVGPQTWGATWTAPIT
jgi:peptidoglycan hydrolase-like protein with peptidoglycan-binding domain